jgi:hypothetical protein
MLQLVGRHEMDKVQLQHESETVQKVRRMRSDLRALLGLSCVLGLSTGAATQK